MKNNKKNIQNANNLNYGVLGTPSFESWFIKDLVFCPFGGWDAEEWYYF